MVLWIVVAAIACTGCGRCNFDPFNEARDDGIVVDMPRSDAAWPDAQDLGPWGTPVFIPELASATEDDDVTLPDDQLEIYFVSLRTGSNQNDIWMSSRATTADTWSTPIQVDALNSLDRENTPKLSRDGLTIWFARGPVGDFSNVWTSTRPNRAMPWLPPTEVMELKTLNDEADPSVAPDGLVMVLRYDVPGSGGDRLSVTSRASASSPWPTPTLLMLAGAPNPTQPFVGETELYFTHLNLGLDLYVAPRLSATTFGTPQPIAELNTGGHDTDAWVSSDRRTIYFCRNDDIWMATR